MECGYAINTGTLNSLSEQELVDRAGRRYGCNGCNAGQMTGAMEGGLCSEDGPLHLEVWDEYYEYDANMWTLFLSTETRLRSVFEYKSRIRASVHGMCRAHLASEGHSDGARRRISRVAKSNYIMLGICGVVSLLK